MLCLLKPGRSDAVNVNVSDKPRSVSVRFLSFFQSLSNYCYRRTGIIFYRAMHYSTKCGIVIARRPSVCLSVCPSVTLVDQDHIGRKSWKLTARTISPTPSLFIAQRTSPTPRGTWGNLGKTRGGVGKSGVDDDSVLFVNVCTLSVCVYLG